MRRKTYGLLALSLGMAVTMMGPAFAVADRVETERANAVRGTNNGQNGYWIEYIVRTYRYVEDASKLAAKNAFLAALKREPSDAELAAYLDLDKAAGDKLSDATLVSLAVSVASKSLSLDTALANIKNAIGLPDLYKSTLGVTWTSVDLAGIMNQVATGAVSLTALKADLSLAKTAMYCDPDLGKEWNHEQHPWNLKSLRANFGKLTGGIDLGVNAMPDSYPGPQIQSGFQLGNRASIVSEASRLVNLYELMKKGVLPEGKITVDGFFTASADLADNPAVYTNIKCPATTSDPQFKSFGADSYWQKIHMTSVTTASLYNAAKFVYNLANDTYSPIAFDLSGNGKIGVTGRSTAKKRKAGNSFVAAGSVMFDIMANRKPIRIEWMSSENDGLLVDDRKGEVTRAAEGDGVISSLNLFGDAEGYDNGYVKLAMVLTQNRYAMAEGRFDKIKTALKGHDLDGLKVWVDQNHDARVQKPELFTLASLGITEVETIPNRVANEFGEDLIQASYVENGKRKLAEDIWFASER